MPFSENIKETIRTSNTSFVDFGHAQKGAMISKWNIKMFEHYSPQRRKTETYLLFLYFIALVPKL